MIAARNVMKIVGKNKQWPEWTAKLGLEVSTDVRPLPYGIEPTYPKGQKSRA